MEHSEDSPIGPLAGAFPELASLTDADLEWAKQQWQRVQDALLAQVTAENLHRAVDTAPAVGGEIW